jgi:hypothetical protein
VEDLAQIKGISEEKALKIIESAEIFRQALAAEEEAREEAEEGAAEDSSVPEEEQVPEVPPDDGEVTDD